MLSTGALADVTLSASGTSVKAHRLVLASCSQYFAQLFKELDTDSNSVVVVLGCEPAELRLLLTFMYTGEVTAPKRGLPALLRLAHTLKVSGLTDADTNSTLISTESEQPAECEKSNSPVNLELKSDHNSNFLVNDNSSGSSRLDDVITEKTITDRNTTTVYQQDLARTERDRLSKLDQIVQNLYSTHKIGNPAAPVVPPGINLAGITPDPPDSYDPKWRSNSVCTVCNKRLSNQYNLRVHMETHAGRRHACRACPHVSRSRDALRKHVAYRHASTQRDTV
ncbi:unnamed protein product [Chilo suppressalis]|uniref:BTB domain-containing protein n=1 Tax=Chilo suppressalis TaxID=168631 RepID=A0ABN8L7R7_CHISP|nr:unnamed protein product [Chilo suppressalis]